MNGGMFNHLVSIVFQAIGADQTIASINKVHQSISKPMTTQGMENYEANIRKAFGVAIQGANETTPAIKRATGGMGDFISAMRRAVIVAPIWMIMRSAMMGVTSLIQNQIKFMLDMEDAMARIKIVGKGTTEEFKNLKNTMVALAFTYGVSASAALDAAQIFAQQGRSVAESIALTRIAMLGSKALGDDIKNVINDLTAAVEGFQIPVNNAITIVDKYVAVEKEFAVTSRDLADATKASAATANQMGITIDEFLGDVTAIVEVTRKSGSEAARALSFVYARLFTTAKSTIEQITKIPFYLDAQGKATNELTGELRGASDIIGELAGRWDTLTKAEKLSIAESLGSKRQMVGVNALMQNYNRSLDARITSLTAAGNAERAFGIIQETTRQKLLELGSAWNALTASISGSSAFKNAIDLLADYLSAWTRVIDISEGARIQILKNQASVIAENELRLSQILSVEGLIKAKEKLAKAPQSEDNLRRIKDIETALQNINKKFPGLDIAIKEGSLEKFTSDIEDRLAEQKIRLNVSVQYIAERTELQTQKKELERRFKDIIKAAPESPDAQKALNKIAIINEKIKNTYKNQTNEITKQTDEYNAQIAVKEASKLVDEEMVDLTGELTDKEKEKLDISKKLIIAKEVYADNTIGLLEYEKKLVEQAKSQYEEHERNILLAELDNKIAEQTIVTNNKMVEHELELAKIRGASSRQLLEIETSLNRQILGENAITNNLDLQYRKELEITKEKMHQNDLSSNSMKIYEIAQKNGIEAATEISKFLQGTISYDRLREMSGIYKIFVDNFSDVDKQMKAKSFFAGQTQTWGATSIPIIEKQPARSFISEALKSTTPINIPNVNITPSFGGININLPKGTLDDLINLSGQKLVDTLKNSKEVQDWFGTMFWKETGKGK